MFISLALISGYPVYTTLYNIVSYYILISGVVRYPDYLFQGLSNKSPTCTVH